MRIGATAAWALYLVAGCALAAYAVVTWIGALLARAPVLYGEGAVANAARLALHGVAYLDLDPERFVAANYPPLYFHIASIGDPFLTGRVVSIAATLTVAAIVFAAARRAGIIAAAALAAGWLALAPVAIWGPAVKPDLVALALTVAGVIILERRRDLAALAGFALIVAAFAKPTALLPGLALAGWLAAVDRPALGRFGLGAAAASAAAAVIVYLDSAPDVWRHVVTWNALGWSVDQALLLTVLAVVVLGVPAGIAGLSGAFRGARAAYLVGALGILASGGRDGATINYLLDLTVAVALGLAAVAPRLRGNPVFPVLALAQLILATAIINPLRVVPGRAPTTGAWADPGRGASVSLAFHVDGRYLLEDSGLFGRTGIQPVVDDLFLWSRLVERGTIDPAPIVGQIRDARIGGVIAEVDLEHLDAAPAYERQRWAAILVRAILERYRLDARAGTLWIYVPR